MSEDLQPPRDSSNDQSVNLYAINTGDIFSDLREQWQRFNTAFLKGEVQDAILNTLCSHEIFRRLPADEEARQRAIHEAERRYQLQSTRIADGDAVFPFVDFCLVNNGGYARIVDFDASCPIAVKDNSFILFFSLRLSLIDVLDVTSFLEFHLEESFGNDTDGYSKYLDGVLLKYEDILKEGHQNELKRFIVQIKGSLEEAEMVDLNKHLDDFTTSRQVLIMHYLLKKASINRHTAALTDMARLIQGLTGRQINAKDIKNTDIYKMISHPLKKGDVSLTADLRFVRDLFDKLNQKELVGEINKEILDRE